MGEQETKQGNGPGSDSVSVAREVGAPAAQVWAMVADVTRMGEWSPETEHAEWIRGATSAVPGAKFRGTNRNGTKRWKTVATVVDADPGRRFSFRVTAPLGLGVAEWAYDFEPTTAGCRVTETFTDQRGWLVRTAGARMTGVSDRAAHNRAGMERTLERLAAAAEGGGTSA